MRKTKRGPAPEDEEVGRKIRIRRIEINLSQKELGDALGVSFQQIQKYEKGVNRISMGRLSEIARRLDVPLSYFFSAENNAQREVDELITIDTKLSIRLLQAYQRIPEGQRRPLILLMERMAGDVE